MIVQLSLAAHAQLAKPHQSEPVALPARKTDHLSDWVGGWNARLDEIAKLVPTGDSN